MTEAAAELGGAKLGDARLNLRRVRVAERLGAQSSSSIPVVCGGWAETQATYRLLAHEAVTDAGGHAGRGAVGGAGCLAMDPRPGDLRHRQTWQQCQQSTPAVQSHRLASRKNSGEFSIAVA